MTANYLKLHMHWKYSDSIGGDAVGGAAAAMMTAGFSFKYCKHEETEYAAPKHNTPYKPKIERKSEGFDIKERKGQKTIFDY